MTRRFAHLSLCVGLLVFTVTTFAIAGNIIHVPTDQPTIQDGIDVASNGDTVLVAPGTYFEQINFNGKNIVVKSANGSNVTTIDGGHTTGPVVRFILGESPKAKLEGFTVQNGSLCCFPYEGGGIEIANSSPFIIDNTIQNNVGAGNGGGVNVHFGAPVIERNRVTGNTVAFTGGTEGAGIDIIGSSPPYTRITSNVIAGNFGVELGGGIGLNNGAGTVIFDNKINGNSAGSQGGAIGMSNQSSEVIVQNLLTNNSAPSGAEIFSLTPYSVPGYVIVNNTIVSDDLTTDAAVIADGSNANAEFVNNIIFSSGMAAALLCNPIYKEGPPIVEYNDGFSQQGISYGDSCSGVEGLNGNISADPQFVNPLKGKYQVRTGSPVIDVGTTSAPDLPPKDLAGRARIINGTIDMGAYEYQGK